MKNGTKLEWIKQHFPLWFKVIKDNPYNIPVGKIFRGRYSGLSLLAPIELYGDRIIYFMQLDEVVEWGTTKKNI